MRPFSLIAELRVRQPALTGTQLRAELARRHGSPGGVARIYRLLRQGRAARGPASCDARAPRRQPRSAAELARALERARLAEEREDAHQSHWAAEVDILRTRLRDARDASHRLPILEATLQDRSRELAAAYRRIADLEASSAVPIAISSTHRLASFVININKLRRFRLETSVPTPPRRISSAPLLDLPLFSVQTSTWRGFVSKPQPAYLQTGVAQTKGRPKPPFSNPARPPQLRSATIFSTAATTAASPFPQTPARTRASPSPGITGHLHPPGAAHVVLPLDRLDRLRPVQAREQRLQHLGRPAASPRLARPGSAPP